MKTAWFWLAAVLAPVPLLDETVHVPQAGWRPYPISLRQRPAVIECQFTVRRGPPIRVWLLDQRELGRFFAGRGVHPVALTGYVRQGVLRHLVGTGDYAVVLDNRFSGGEPVEVHLRITLDFAGSEVRELPPERRAVVVAASLLFLIGVGYWVNRRLGPKLRARFLR